MSFVRAAFVPSVFALALAAPAHGQLAGPADHVDEAAATARGLYFTGPFVRGRGAAGVIDQLRAAHLDTAVLDLKDATGRVHHDTAIADLEAQESGMFGDDRQLLADLRAAGVRSVARIVCFNDPVLAMSHPERAILDGRARHEGEVWQSWGTGGGWLDPWDPANQELVLTLAEEAEALGFDEVQLDYIRFPVDDAREWAVYPDERPGVGRPELLHDLLARMDTRIDIPIGVDVFGIQAFHPGDRSGLGQDLELWADHVDVFCPMLYLHSMSEWEVGTEDRARRLVERGVRTLRGRLGPGPIIRPFLQAFETGADEWNPHFIAEQIRGSRRGGADGFLFWNAGAVYGMVQRAMIGPARALSPFPVPEDRREARTVGLGG